MSLENVSVSWKKNSLLPLILVQLSEFRQEKKSLQVPRVNSVQTEGQNLTGICLESYSWSPLSFTFLIPPPPLHRVSAFWAIFCIFIWSPSSSELALKSGCHGCCFWLSLFLSAPCRFFKNALSSTSLIQSLSTLLLPLSLFLKPFPCGSGANFVVQQHNVTALSSSF